MEPVHRRRARPARLRAQARPAGFTDIAIAPTRTFTIDDVDGFLAESGITDPAIARAVDGLFMSAIITATKPDAADQR
jgi:hypothetical protein